MQLPRLLLLVCIPLFAVSLFRSDIIVRWNDQLYDIELNLFDWKADDSVVIVAIDEQSLSQLGRWPWSRHRHAELIDILTNAGVAAIGLDIIFAEPDSGESQADVALAKAIRQSGRVALPVFPIHVAGHDGFSVATPIPILSKAAAALGHVHIAAGSDGIVRSVYLQAYLGHTRWPALPLALLNLSQEHTLKNPLTDRYSTERIRPDNGAWNFRHRVLFPFPNPNTQITQISYSDVLNNPNVTAALRGKLILIGVTAAGLAQHFAIPDTDTTGKPKLMTGVELNATILRSLYTGLVIHPINPTMGSILTFIFVLFAIISYSVVTSRWVLLMTAIFSLFVFTFSLLMLWNFRIWYTPGPVIIGLLLSYPIWSWQRLQAITKTLYQEKEQTKATLHSIGDGVVTTDANGIVQYMNPIAEEISGFKNAQAKSQHISKIFTFNDGECITEVKNSNRPDSAPNPRFLNNRLGKKHAVRTSKKPIVGKTGTLFGMVYAFSDITEILNISKKMAYMATHDMLTRLPNRVLLGDRLTQAIGNASRSNRRVAILFIDLDGFKKINDGMGHQIGDQLLKDVAGRLCGTLRQVDTAARWGGDEFVVLLEGLSQTETITGVAVKIHNVLSKPFHIDSEDLFVTSSIGISVFPKDGSTAETLIDRADAAMYRVKKSGSNNFCFYSQGMNDHAKARLVMEKDLHNALSGGDFEILYQPQVEIRSNRIVGMEALLRWHHPQKGLIPPDCFIPLAEEVGLIDDIGLWVLETVCRQLNDWQERGLPMITAAINLSPRQFMKKNLLDIFGQTLHKNHLNRGCLQIEITENLMMNDIDQVTDLLLAIKELGIFVSIDDFGTGFSSLNLLKQIPVDELKIDMSFVRNVVSDPKDANIAKTIIGLAHNMDIYVVAEGVENTDQYRLFKQWGCDRIQGFYFSKPLNSAEMTQLICSNGGVMAHHSES